MVLPRLVTSWSSQSSSLHVQFSKQLLPFPLRTGEGGVGAGVPVPPQGRPGAAPRAVPQFPQAAVAWLQKFLPPSRSHSRCCCGRYDDVSGFYF